MMNALEAAKKLAKLNERIEALDFAYHEIYFESDKRYHANILSEMQMELEQERNILSERLRSMEI